MIERFGEEGLPLLPPVPRSKKRGAGTPTTRRSEPASPTASPGSSRDLFPRLQPDDNHGALIVERALSYIAVSRNGLSEDELLDTLSDDAEVLADFARRSPLSPTVDRLRRGLVAVVPRSQALSHRATSRRRRVLRWFFHRQCAEAVEAEFLAGGARAARHRHLAEFFAAQGIQLRGGGIRRANVARAVRVPVPTDQW